jgi:hypothetical protein
MRATIHRFAREVLRASPLRSASEGDLAPLELSMERLRAPGQWPARCGVCGAALAPGLRILLCSSEHTTCLLCAIGCIRASLERDVALCALSARGARDAPCVYLPDAVAAAFHAPRLAAEARGVPEAALLRELGVEKPLAAREARLVLRGLELAHYARPALFSFEPCPGCAEPLLLPAAAAAARIPAYCHGCSHRVCVPCGALWRESGHGAGLGCGAAAAGARAAACPRCGERVAEAAAAAGGCSRVACRCGEQLCRLCGGLYGRSGAWGGLGAPASAHGEGCPQRGGASRGGRANGALPLALQLVDPAVALLAAWGLTRLAPALRAPAGRARNIVAAAAAVRLLPSWLALLGFPLLPALEWLRAGSLAEARGALLPALCVPLAACAAGRAAGAAAVALCCRG